MSRRGGEKSWLVFCFLFFFIVTKYLCMKALLKEVLQSSHLKNLALREAKYVTCISAAESSPSFLEIAARYLLLLPRAVPARGPVTRARGGPAGSHRCCARLCPRGAKRHRP